MIDFRQIRAARALLDWSQTDLARASGVATSSIKNVESETTTARRDTLGLIKNALEMNGIEFTPGSGVRLKTDIISVYDGRRATTALVDDIYTHAIASPDREVCILGMDEGHAVETDGEELLKAHIARLNRAGVRERILVCEGDSRFINTPESYRWLPRDYFTRVSPIYVYGDRVAIYSGSLRRKTIIVHARPLAQHLRKLFYLLWSEVAFAPRVMHEERRSVAG